MATHAQHTLMSGDYTRPLDDPETGGAFGAQRLVQGTASLVAARTGLNVRAVQTTNRQPWSYSLGSDALGFTLRSALTGHRWTRGEGMALTVHEIGHRMHTAPFDGDVPATLTRYLYPHDWFGWINGAEDVRMERIQAHDWPGFLAVRPAMIQEALDYRFDQWAASGSPAATARAMRALTDPVFLFMAIHGLAGDQYGVMPEQVDRWSLYPAIPAAGEYRNAPAEVREDEQARAEYWRPRYLSASGLFGEAVLADSTPGMFPALAACVLALAPPLEQSEADGPVPDYPGEVPEDADDDEPVEVPPGDGPGPIPVDDSDGEDPVDDDSPGGDPVDAEGDPDDDDGDAEGGGGGGTNDDDSDEDDFEGNGEGMDDDWNDPQSDADDGQQWIHEQWRQEQVDEFLKAAERDRRIANKGKNWGRTKGDRAAAAAGPLGQWIGDAAAAPPSAWSGVALPGVRTPEGVTTKSVRQAVSETTGRNVRALRRVLDDNATGGVQRRTRRGRLDRRRAGRIVTHADARIFRRPIAPDGITDWALFLAVDTSGSMGYTERRECVGIVTSLLDAAKRMQGVHVGGCAYDGKIAACYPPGQPVDLVDWSSAIMYSSGGTDESRALDVAYWSLMDHDHPGKIALVLTDGIPAERDQCGRKAAAMNAMGIHTIGIGISGARPDYHPYWASVPNLTDLPGTLAAALRHVMSGGDHGELTPGATTTTDNAA